MILHHVTEAETAPLGTLLDYIRREHGVVGPEDAEAILLGDDTRLPNGRTPWLVTFDDGFASNFEIARTALKPRGIRALFFVCPGLVDAPAGDQERFVDEYVFPADTWKPSWPIPRLMTWQEIRALAEMGHSIGSHSMLHRRLSGLADTEVEADVEQSAGRLKQEVGVHPRWFAFPFGNLESASEQVLSAVARRFKFCCSGVRGVNTPSTHRTAVLRDSVDLSAPGHYQKLIADGGLDPLYRRQRKRLSGMVAAIPRQSVA